MNFSGDANHFYVYKTTEKSFLPYISYYFPYKTNFTKMKVFETFSLEMNFSGDANDFYVYKTTGKAFFPV